MVSEKICVLAVLLVVFRVEVCGDKSTNRRKLRAIRLKRPKRPRPPSILCVSKGYYRSYPPPLPLHKTSYTAQTTIMISIGLNT